MPLNDVKKKWRAGLKISNFAKLRHERGLIQIQVAKMLGIHHRLVSKYEDGHLFKTQGDQKERLEKLHEKWIKETLPN